MRRTEPAARWCGCCSHLQILRLVIARKEQSGGFHGNICRHGAYLDANTPRPPLSALLSSLGSDRGLEPGTRPKTRIGGRSVTVEALSVHGVRGTWAMAPTSHTHTVAVHKEANECFRHERNRRTCRTQDRRNLCEDSISISRASCKVHYRFPLFEIFGQSKNSAALPQFGVLSGRPRIPDTRWFFVFP